MDVSDINILQTIYSILSASGSRHLQFSLYEFCVFLISELRKRNIQIRILDEDVPLYAANEKVIICFPEKEESEDNILLFLLGILIPHADSFLIAYAIQNKQGAYVIRFELPIGFVSSRKKGWNDEKQDIGPAKQDIELPDGLSAKTKKNILALFERFGFDQHFRRTEVMETLSLTASPASALISKMLVSDLIVPISGYGKGKYIFTNNV